MIENCKRVYGLLVDFDEIGIKPSDKGIWVEMTEMCRKKTQDEILKEEENGEKTWEEIVKDFWFPELKKEEENGH